MKPRNTAAVAVALLALTGCAANVPSGQPEIESDIVESETHEHRLLVSDAESGGLLVLDADDGSTVDELALEGPSALYPLNEGRYAVAVQTDAGSAQLVDAGTWLEGHGDHDHYYTAPPAVVPGTIEGPSPVHVTQADGVTTVFMDGDGSAHFFELDEVQAGLAAERSETADPHHGVAYVLPGGERIASFSNADGRATGVRVTDADGGVLAESADCLGLHGETEIEGAFVFACADGLLTLETETWAFTTTPYPVEGRTGTLIADDAGERAYGIVDGTTLIGFDGATTTATPLPGLAIGFAVADAGDVIVINADGSVARVTPSGEVTASAPLLGEFDPESDHSVPRPAVIVEGTRAYLSDPASDRVIIAFADTLEVIETVDTGFTPKSIALVG